MSTVATDMSLLRFLRARVDESEALNAPGAGSGQPGTGPLSEPGSLLPALRSPTSDIAGRLMQAARALLGRGDREGMPYDVIATSPEFAAYRALTNELRELDPATLDGRRERTAFWVNLYNALVMDAVITFRIHGSIREEPGFFRRAAYRVGPHRLSLEEIEHGLLRCNRPQFARLPPPFLPGDPRATLGPGVLDPRVHFALNCGTRSCPPVAFYEAARLDRQLEAAASTFINAEGARLEDGALIVSPIFDFYEEDFGGAEGTRAWLLRYLVDPALRARVAEAPIHAGVYDWTLNRGSG